ncbi:MAG: histone deacetylase family protein [Gemmatimonadota bacterium]
MTLQLWTSARFAIPLPPGHRFPLVKYQLLRDRVLTDGVASSVNLFEPERVPLDALLRVHSADYVERFLDGAMSEQEMRRLGFPWSPALVERSLRAAGGTLATVARALDAGIAMNLAGGTHHAFADHGEGFCVFNDVAVAIRHFQALRRVRRAVIIDLDVHQGNGTNAIFAGDESVFTFSMHGMRNYPFRKVPGSLDVGLDDGTTDEVYLDRLATDLSRALRGAGADLAVYLAGADPLAGDRLGRLALSMDGLARRDHFVIRACREIGLPVAITIAGGYGRDIAETVSVHAATARIAAEYC